MKSLCLQTCSPPGIKLSTIFFIFRISLRKLKTLCLQICSPPGIKLSMVFFIFWLSLHKLKTRCLQSCSVFTPKNEVEVGYLLFSDFLYLNWNTLPTSLFTPRNKVEVQYFWFSDFLYMNLKRFAYKPVHPHKWGWCRVFLIFRLSLHKLKTLCLQTCSPPGIKLR